MSVELFVLSGDPFHLSSPDLPRARTNSNLTAKCLDTVAFRRCHLLARAVAFSANAIILREREQTILAQVVTETEGLLSYLDIL